MVRKNITPFALAFLILFLAGCIAQRDFDQELVSINIVDHNGFSETISSQDRLNQYKNVDFCSPLPYQKVLRVYKRNQNGDIKSILSKYYDNGQIKQYLELTNGRAYGYYREWHQNGGRKLEAFVIGGNPDLDAGAEATWLFEGLTQAWDEYGHLIAEIPYKKGELEGVAHYYHANGKLWKQLPYKKNLLEGTTYVYLEDGSLLQKSEFAEGFNDGLSIRYWTPELIASKEDFKDGYLVTGEYFSKTGKRISEVSQGEGIKAIFSKDGIAELHEYHGGIPNGEVKVFNHLGKQIGSYHLKDNMKEGEEVLYYESLSHRQQKLSIEWHNDLISGLVKTWYPNGEQESQREMYQNQKHGLSTAWYEDGSLMLLEEYKRDKLVKGKYFRKGETEPISQVINGRGKVVLHDPEGNLLLEQIYVNGVPADEQLD